MLLLYYHSVITMYSILLRTLNAFSHLPPQNSCDVDTMINTVLLERAFTDVTEVK